MLQVINFRSCTFNILVFRLVNQKFSESMSWTCWSVGCERHAVNSFIEFMKIFILVIAQVLHNLEDSCIDKLNMGVVY